MAEGFKGALLAIMLVLVVAMVVDTIYAMGARAQRRQMSLECRANYPWLIGFTRTIK